MTISGVASVSAGIVRVPALILVHLVVTAALLAAKNAFYAVLLEGCGNQVVGQILTQLNNRVTLLRRLSLSQAGRLPRARACPFMRLLRAESP